MHKPKHPTKPINTTASKSSRSHPIPSPSFPASFYSLAATDIHGNSFPFHALQSHVVLIVNVASTSTFTPHYEGLQLLYDTYKEDGFVVIGFPCNQFYGEPGDAKEVLKTCKKFGITFPIMSKVDVNGSDAHEVYRWLKANKKHSLGIIIKWDFEKFLIDRNGNIHKRYNFSIPPESLEEDIVKLLQKPASEPS